jgi:hypothetical protein
MGSELTSSIGPSSTRRNSWVVFAATGYLRMYHLQNRHARKLSYDAAGHPVLAFVARPGVVASVFAHCEEALIVSAAL